MSPMGGAGGSFARPMENGSYSPSDGQQGSGPRPMPNARNVPQYQGQAF